MVYVSANMTVPVCFSICIRPLNNSEHLTITTTTPKQIIMINITETQIVETPVKRKRVPFDDSDDSSSTDVEEGENADPSLANQPIAYLDIKSSIPNDASKLKNSQQASSSSSNTSETVLTISKKEFVERIPLLRGRRYCVGRVKEAGVDIALQKGTLSRKHAILHIEQSEVAFVEDLSSKNKTRLVIKKIKRVKNNNRRKKSKTTIILHPNRWYQVLHGNVLVFGDVVTTFYWASELVSGKDKRSTRVGYESQDTDDYDDTESTDKEQSVVRNSSAETTERNVNTSTSKLPPPAQITPEVSPIKNTTPLMPAPSTSSKSTPSKSDVLESPPSTPEPTNTIIPDTPAAKVAVSNTAEELDPTQDLSFEIEETQEHPHGEEDDPSRPSSPSPAFRVPAPKPPSASNSSSSRQAVVAETPPKPPASSATEEQDLLDDIPMTVEFAEDDGATVSETQTFESQAGVQKPINQPKNTSSVEGDEELPMTMDFTQETNAKPPRPKATSSNSNANPILLSATDTFDNSEVAPTLQLDEEEQVSATVPLDEGDGNQVVAETQAHTDAGDTQAHTVNDNEEIGETQDLLGEEDLLNDKDLAVESKHNDSPSAAEANSTGGVLITTVVASTIEMTKIVSPPRERDILDDIGETQAIPGAEIEEHSTVAPQANNQNNIDHVPPTVAMETEEELSDIPATVGIEELNEEEVDLKHDSKIAPVSDTSAGTAEATASASEDKPGKSMQQRDLLPPETAGHKPNVHDSEDTQQEEPASEVQISIAHEKPAPNVQKIHEATPALQEVNLQPEHTTKSSSTTTGSEPPQQENEVPTPAQNSQSSQQPTSSQGEENKRGTKRKRTSLQSSSQSTQLLESSSQSTEQTNAAPNPNTSTAKDEESGAKSSKRRRKHAPHILFTGVTPTQKDLQAIKKLGGLVVESVKDATHLVTDKVHRTVKFLSALASGVHIISMQWIAESQKAKTFLEEDAFILKDEQAEQKFNFSLRESLKRRTALLDDDKKIFTGYQFFITPNTKPGPADMKQILELCDAEVLETMRAVDRCASTCYIISCAEDWKMCKEQLTKHVDPSRFYLAEFVLSSIMNQEISKDTSHKLNLESEPQPTSSQTGSQKSQGPATRRKR